MRSIAIAKQNTFTSVGTSVAHGGAIILGGAKRGQKFKCSTVDVDEQKWRAVGSRARYDTDFLRAGPEEKKDACFVSLE